jgi:hypothetical protein
MKRIIRKRFLTPEEAAKNKLVREQVEAEFPKDFQLTYDNRLELGMALRELAEVIYSRGQHEAISHIKKAISALNTIIGDLNPVPTLIDWEAELSGRLNTYLRKGTDTHLSVILYHLVEESRGMGVWITFVRALAEKQINAKNFAAAVRAASGCSSATDDIIMLMSLEIWAQDKKEMDNLIEWMKWVAK